MKPNPSIQPLNSGKLTDLIALKTGIIEVAGRQLVPVETASYKTIDFRDPAYKKAILYSGMLSACPIVLIKNFNPDTKKYDNVVTMAHFFPNNAYDEKTAQQNLEPIIADFEKHGGKLTKDTSIILLGGMTQHGEDISVTSKGVLHDTITTIMKLGAKCKYTNHETSINKWNVNNERTISSIFVDQFGTQIIKKGLDSKGKSDGSVSLVTPPSETLPLDFLRTVQNEIPKDYTNFMYNRQDVIAQASISRNGMGMHDMEQVVFKGQTGVSRS